jgi:acyl-CoA hydrolase
MEKSDNLEVIVEKIIEKVGPQLVMGIPLGAGKPNPLVNAIYQKVKSNQNLSLTILTALTLQKPGENSFIEKRFFGPLNKRVFGNYPELEYAVDRDKNKVPTNIKIIEFYYPPGKLLNNSYAQRNYLSTNYTHAVRDILDRGVNLICQQVAKREVEGDTLYSLSCNTDITVDIINGAHQRGMSITVVGQVNQQLPFMYGESILTSTHFDLMLDDPTLEFKVFGPPKMSVTAADYLIGFHSSTLVKDDGEIQIGIGSLGDALVYALCLRHEENDRYMDYLRRLDISPQVFPVLKKFGDFGHFHRGLFAATEMFVDSFIFLFQAKILKKKVYDHVVIQRLLNSGELDEDFNPGIIDLLIREKAIGTILSRKDFEFLKEFGIFRQSLKWVDNKILLEDGTSIGPNLLDNMLTIKSRCLGSKLRNGAVSHAGFFLGPNSFYKYLKDLPIATRKLIRMKQISKINHLYGHEEIDRLQRKNGRFINNCMKVMLNGAACSDALENNKQVSGVGGQYNFVAMAHELPDARSILQLRSTRTNSKGKVESNIVLQYGNCTVPRHLRDIVVTEYGIADLRGKTDEEVAIELIQIADSRFQSQLMAKAKKTGKLPYSYKLDERFKNNFPWKIKMFIEAEQEKGFFSPFPFGTDFTDEEIKIGKALKYLKKIKGSKIGFLFFLLGSFFYKVDSQKFVGLLRRMELQNPKAFKEKLMKKILLNAFEKSSS